MGAVSVPSLQLPRFVGIDLDDFPFEGHGRIDDVLHLASRMARIIWTPMSCTPCICSILRRDSSALVSMRQRNTWSMDVPATR